VHVRTRNLQIEHRAIEALKPSPKNARTHSKHQLKKLAKSMAQVGFIAPIIVDGENQIIAGHARLEAAKTLGYKEVPTLSVTDLNEVEIRAYALADNRLCELGEWDNDLLRVELEYLTQIDLEVDLDVEMTGFGMGEIDILLAEPEECEETPVPDPPDESSVVTHLGDVWQLGPHRIVCGDCRDPAILDRLMSGKIAQMQISDPPYNVPTAGHISTADKAGHGDFGMAAGEMTPLEFTAFLIDSQNALVAHCATGSLHYLFMDWRHMTEMLQAVETVYSLLVNLIVWVKTNGGMGSLYRSQHELVFVAKKGTAPHINNIQLGKNGRNRTNVWQYPGMNTFAKDRDDALKAHPTVKPTQLVADAILDASHRGEIILDGFLGSGTTLLAAEKTGRIGFGVEYEPRYVDVAIQRWQTLTGKQAIHTTSQRPYCELAAHIQEMASEGDTSNE
jgi:DNA modification methylase